MTGRPLGRLPDRRPFPLTSWPRIRRRHGRRLTCVGATARARRTEWALSMPYISWMTPTGRCPRRVNASRPTPSRSAIPCMPGSRARSHRRWASTGYGAHTLAARPRSACITAPWPRRSTAVGSSPGSTAPCAPPLAPGGRPALCNSPRLLVRPDLPSLQVCGSVAPALGKPPAEEARKALR
jgi:hypothetical protein